MGDEAGKEGHEEGRGRRGRHQRKRQHSLGTEALPRKGGATSTASVESPSCQGRPLVPGPCLSVCITVINVIIINDIIGTWI